MLIFFISWGQEDALSPQLKPLVVEPPNTQTILLLSFFLNDLLFEFNCSIDVFNSLKSNKFILNLIKWLISILMFLLIPYTNDFEFFVIEKISILENSSVKKIEIIRIKKTKKIFF